ncbi:unnamed protein product [Phyllotreta striolata]|uniref:Piwi n=1 Tax=Phyllotreta striolata TaxID=444603 RepID=A0A9P0GUY2_PHYSR|nr:unnamed protein product [Phyllotreta striolata]
MEPRGKGRARGRARGGPPQGAETLSAPGTSQATAQKRIRPGDPWSRPMGPQQPPNPALQAQAPTQWVRPQMPTPTASVGRGTRLGGGDAHQMPMEVEHEGAVRAGGDSGNTAQVRGGGNGGVRGRNLRSEIIHTRPKDLVTKQGTAGSSINLISNYFEIIQAGKFVLQQYRVDYNPEIDHTPKKKWLLHQAMREVVKGYLFDGTVLYTTAHLQPDPMEKFVDLENGEKVRITLRSVGELKWGDFHYIQVFNRLVRNLLEFMDLKKIQDNYFDPQLKETIPDHQLELWPGFFTSIRQHEGQLLLNCELKFKVMRMDNCYDMFLECRSSRNRQEFQSRIIGSIVLTYYNNKTYRIDDVDFNLTPSSTFKLKDGREITFAQYYIEKYNIRIQAMNQPLLISRSKPKEIRSGMPELVILVPELCTLTGLTDRQRENFQLMRAMGDKTRVGPAQRIRKLEEFSSRLRRCPKAVEQLKSWDMKLADTLIRFKGRVMPPEAILGGNNVKLSSGPNAEWTRELRSLQMFSAVKIPKFAVVCPGKFANQCSDFVQMLQRVSRGFQWDIGQPRIFDIPDDRANSYLECIESVITKNNPNMIMCIVPNNSADRYSAIKKKCCVDRGVPSQVVLSKQFSSKGAMSIATKIAIQLNCKVGGAPWSVIMPLSNLMVVGYDVCRDTTKKGKSFAGMVASLNKQMTRYFNLTSEHSLEEELSENIAAFLILACHKYKEVNGTFPERILIYRDGVGDGQMAYVIEHEVENIKKKLTKEIYTGDNLRFTFVVVSKRINTRFFTQDGKNPPPGTVVDDVVTLPQRYDFFIVSQCVNQGSVSPTSYNVISDNMGLPPEKLQILTYKMCHLYYNWCGTVRVPAVCQYAHKLAFLTAQSLHRPANRALETVLYYL